LFFSMPQDSLITLSAQRPVWNKILSYLPMAAKKNLRLSHPRDLKDALLDDPTWIWTVNLGDQIQYPEFFYNSSTLIKLNFPRNQNGDLIYDPDISDQMIELIDNDKIKPRIVGLAVHQETLNQYTDHLRINSLQFIEIDGEYEVMSEIAMQLLTSNCDSLQEITLREMDMDDNISHMLNSVTFHNVKKLQLIWMRCDLSKLLLRACPNVQHLRISGNIDIEDEDGLMLTSVKKMELESTTCTSILLRMVPNVEELTIRSGIIDIPNEDFSLIHLTKLSLKKVGMSTSTMNILKAKLPEALKLEDCMD